MERAKQAHESVMSFFTEEEVNTASLAAAVQKHFEEKGEAPLPAQLDLRCVFELSTFCSSRRLPKRCFGRKGT